MDDSSGTNLKEVFEAKKLIKQFKEELASLKARINGSRIR